MPWYLIGSLASMFFAGFFTRQALIPSPPGHLSVGRQWAQNHLRKLRQPGPWMTH